MDNLLFNFTFNHLGISVELTQTLSVCSFSVSSFTSFWFPSICFETILFTLALYKGVEHFKARVGVNNGLNKDKGGLVKSVIECMIIGSSGGASTRGNSMGWKGQRALDILVRDSVLYYGL